MLSLFKCTIKERVSTHFFYKQNDKIKGCYLLLLIVILDFHWVFGEDIDGGNDEDANVKKLSNGFE